MEGLRKKAEELFFDKIKQYNKAKEFWIHYVMFTYKGKAYVLIIDNNKYGWNFKVDELEICKE